MEEKLVTRKNIILEAYNRCIKEMYANAQPPANYDELLELAKAGKEDEKNPFYNQHYLSHEEYMMIMDKYIDAYGLDTHFNDHCETILDYLDNGMIVKYRDNDEVDRRRYEKLEPIKDIIGEEAYNAVVKRIKQAMSFYRFDADKSQFSFSVAFGCSPTSNKETVIEYWKSQGKDIVIKDRDEDEMYCRYYEGVTDVEED